MIVGPWRVAPVRAKGAPLRRAKRRAVLHLLASVWIAAPLASLAQAATAPSASINARIDALFAEWDSTMKPGCAVAVSRNGVVLHERGYGMANLEHGVPNRPDTVFHIASVSKQFTAAAIALLILEGKLSPDDPIRRHLPEMPAFDVPITLADLIHHSSGLHDYSYALSRSGWRWWQDRVTTEDAMRVIVRQQRLLFAPGSRYHYSNTNYLLLARIVERVSGQPLGHFTAERIFKPLDMESSRFQDDFSAIVPGFAAGYAPSGEGFVTSLTQFSFVGSSTLLTSVRDLMAWERNFHGGQVGGQALIDLMLTPGTLTDGTPNRYAYGVVVGEYRGMRVVEHSGSDAGYVAHLLRLPEQRLSVAVLCNTNAVDAKALAQQTAEVSLGLAPQKPARGVPAGVSPVAVALPERALKAKVGRYSNLETEQALAIQLGDGRLYAVFGNEQLELTPLGVDRFSLRKGRWELAFAPGDRPAQITLHDRYQGPSVLQRVDDYDPDAAELQAYVGRYSSPDLLAPFRLDIVDGRPLLRTLKSETVLMPITPDFFAAGPFNVRFRRDDAGRILGFRYGRSNEVVFDFVKETP